MKKKILMVLFMTTLILSGCGTSHPTEELEETPAPEIETPTYVTYEMLDEVKNFKISDGTIQIINSLITLPIKFSELENAGLYINTTFTSEFTRETIMEAKQTAKIYMTTNDTDIISIVVENKDDKLSRLSDCIVTSIDISRTTSPELNASLSGLVYMICGTTYGQNIENYTEALSELGITPAHTRFEKTDLLNYVDGDYSFSIFYDTESKNIVELNYKIYNPKEVKETTDAVMIDGVLIEGGIVENEIIEE